MKVSKILALTTVFILTCSFLSIAPLQNARSDIHTSNDDADLSKKGTRNMYVLVNSSIYGSLGDQLDQYKQDVEKLRDLKVKIFENDYSEASEIRSFLKDGYENDNLVGTFFVGNIPYAEFEVSNDYDEGRYSRFPIDLYYKDLDGTWRDTNNSGVYDEHVSGDGDLKPEIWFGRISMKTDWKDEVELYKNYFEKLYKYRRGNLSLPDESLLYVDDDWTSWTDKYKSGLAKLYSDIKVVDDPDNTSADDYGKRLKEGYEWIQIHCHANHSAKRHAFKDHGGPKGSGGNFTSRDLYEQGQKSLFANIFTCGSADYTVPDYLCGWYALTGEYGLANVGSTKPGSMLEFQNYYEPLSNGMTMGEAMKEWWIDTVKNDIYSISWFYGMTTIGDPTLSPLTKGLEDYDLNVETQGKGEIEIDPNQNAYEYGTEVDLTAIPADGWYLDEWNGTDKTGKTITITMDSDKDITVRFSEKSAQEINDWYDLDQVRLREDYCLMRDLDENTSGYDEVVDTEDGFDPIGGQGITFKGTFEGKGHEIKDLYINRSKTYWIGLFGAIDKEAEVTNLSVVDADIKGDEVVGGLVGMNQGTVSNSHFTGTLEGSSAGIVGLNGGQLKNSYYNIDEVLINGKHQIDQGGLFDSQYQDWISNNKTLDISDYSDTLEPADGHYEISDVNGLKNLLGFADYKEYRFQLTRDIDLSDEPGLYIPHLAAEFDGDGHIISNLFIDMPFNSNAGMFGQLRGKVSNLRVVDATVSGRSNVGGLVGSNYKGTVENSYVAGDVKATSKRKYTRVGGLVGSNYEGTVENSYAACNVTGTAKNYTSTGGLVGTDSVGGLVGSNYEGTVENSHVTGNITGYWNVGGLVGSNDEGTIENSYAACNVTGTAKNYTSAGGLVGTNNNQGLVNNSYAAGDVSGHEYVGGLVGTNSYSIVKNSYSISKVSGETDVGGLVGFDKVGIMKNSFWDTEISGIKESGDGTGKTTEEMKNVATYTDTSTEGLEDSWDFVDDPYDDTGDEDVWNINEDEEINDGYPFLTWEEEEVVEYNLKINKEGNGSTDPLEGIHTYDKGQVITIEATSAEGWEFTGWEGDLTSSETSINVTLDGNKEITANFEQENDKEDDNEDNGEGLPGFTTTLLMLSAGIAITIYKSKKR